MANIISKHIYNIILFFSIIWNCSILCIAQPNSHSTRISAIPSYAVAKIDSLIISRTGEVYFHKYLVFDTLESGLFQNVSKESRYIGHPYYYSFAYWFRFPDKPWHRILEALITDTIPSINKHMVDSYPDCLLDPSLCNFLVDSSMAISIAKNAFLDTYLNSLSAKLFFSTPSPACWLVICDFKPNTSFIENVMLRIDINSGKIISQDTMRSH